MFASTLDGVTDTAATRNQDTWEEGHYGDAKTANNLLYKTPINQGAATTEFAGVYDESSAVGRLGEQPQATRVKTVLDDVFDNVGRQGSKMRMGGGQRSGKSRVQGGQSGNEVVKAANKVSDYQGMSI